MQLRRSFILLEYSDWMYHWCFIFNFEIVRRKVKNVLRATLEFQVNRVTIE